MTKRLAAAGVLAAVALALVAAPAGAHEEINPKTFTVGTPTFFTLSAANEEKVDLVKVVVTAPADAPFGETTREPTDWTADVAENGATITFSGGAVKPGRFESFGFETDGAKQAGALDYKVTLTFGDGKSEDVTVPVTAQVAGSTTASKSDDSSGKATVALVLAVIALVAGLAALGLALARRTSRDGAPTDKATAAQW
jgi:hypothetical protein